MNESDNLKQFKPLPLGEKIRHIRDLRQMSTTDVARATGLSQSYISSLETGTRKSPTKATLDKIAAILRVPPSYFMEEEILTPFDVLSDVPSDIKEFMLEQENMPYFKISQKAKEKGISPEMLDNLLSTLIQIMSKKK